MIMRRRKRNEEEIEDAFSTQSVLAEIEGQLTIDVYQTEDEIVVESTIAGVDPDEIEIDATSDSVTIRGERRKDSQVSQNDYFYQECFWGKFSRSVILPQEIDPDDAYSSLKNGVLTVHLPKIHKDKTRKISINKKG